MKLDKKIEAKIKKEAIKFLKQGKPGWDIPHTLNAVRWIKKLIKLEGGDEKILIPAVYFHDTGYPPLKKGYNYKKLIDSKKNHALIAVQNAKSVLKKLNYFTKKEIDRMCYLVKNHDLHHNIKEKDRQLLFEADTFAMINWQVLPPNFDKANTIKFMDNYFSLRKKYLKTKTGKSIFDKLYPLALKYIDNWPKK